MAYLVDGHNALHRLGIEGADHAAQRAALLRFVRSISPAAVVFFDARRATPGLPNAYREEGVRVRYCRNEEADRAILRHVRDADRPGDLIVVSDDGEVRHGARQLGARSVTVSDFAALLDAEAEQEPEKPDSGTGGFSPEDFGLPSHVNLKHPPRDLRED